MVLYSELQPCSADTISSLMLAGEAKCFHFYLPLKTKITSVARSVLWLQKSCLTWWFEDSENTNGNGKTVAIAKRSFTSSAVF